MARIVFSRTHPVTGQPNPYRTRWALVDGVVFEIRADFLYDPWFVWPDTSEAIKVDPSAVLAYHQADQAVCPHETTLTLAEARRWIADLVASPAWPAARDAWLALPKGRKS